VKVVNIFKKNMKLFLIMFDILSIVVAYYFSCFLVHDASYSVSNIFFINLLLAIVIYELIFNGFEVYKHIVKYENGKENRPIW
jgi:FlaA1/EpsC-like NDP-sugar epimerase